MLVSGAVVASGAIAGGVLANRTRSKKRRAPVIRVLSQPEENYIELLPEPGNLIQRGNRAIRSGIDALVKLKQEKLDVYIEDSYAGINDEFTMNETEISEEEASAARMMKHSYWVLGSMALCLLIHPPLIYLNVPFMIYTSMPFYKEGFDDLFRKRKVTFMGVDAVWGLLTVPYVLIKPQFMIYGEVAALYYAYIFKNVARSKNSTRKELTDLFGEQPKSVWILKDGLEIEVPFESIEISDIVVVDAGQMIPFDGEITDGVASVDQHMLTGESQPAEKSVGDSVFAATVVLSGRIFVQVEKAGLDTAAAQIGQILNHTSDYTSSLQLRGKEFADRASVPTLALGLVAVPTLGVGKALAVLYAGIGRSMEVFGPLSVMNYLQMTARYGILVKDGRALEQVANVDTIVFDKTGTLTLEQPHVGTIQAVNGYDEAYILSVAAAAEDRQSHPIARAIIEEAEARGFARMSISDAAYEIGYGIKVTLDGKLIRVGSQRFMSMEEIAIPAEVAIIADEAHQQGHSLVYVAVDDELGGTIELVPTVRPEAKEIVANLRQRGIDMYIISGDHERPTRALAESLGIPNYFAETLPEHKADHIERLQSEGKFVCFVGDGINDAIALRKAQISVSIRGASTIATDTAEIILMDQTLNQLVQLFDISQSFETNMKLNLASTIVPGVIIIGGAFAGLISFGAAIPIGLAGVGFGVINSMRPLFSTKHLQDRAQLYENTNASTTKMLQE